LPVAAIPIAKVRDPPLHRGPADERRGPGTPSSVAPSSVPPRRVWYPYMEGDHA